MEALVSNSLDHWVLRGTLLAVACVAGNCAWAADPPLESGTNLSIGPAVYVTPSYPGASSSRGFALPYLDAEYAGRFYTNASDLVGVYAYKTVGDALGAALQYDFTERLSKDNGDFKYFSDVKATPRFKLFADKTIGAFTADFNIATDIAGRGQGTLAQANLFVTIPIVPKWVFSFGPGLMWADHEYMTTFFTITPQQAAVSPLHSYTAGAGVDDLHLNAIVTYAISSRWGIGASAYEARLHGTADGSPVTTRREQTTALAWLVYKVR
jgi:MipA family protein